jgi:Domain of Kin17 curved DNA-binding protein
MNSTRWLTLTEFVKHLGREGKVKVDETDKGWYITIIKACSAACAGQGHCIDAGDVAESAASQRNEQHPEPPSVHNTRCCQSG